MKASARDRSGKNGSFPQAAVWLPALMLAAALSSCSPDSGHPPGSAADSLAILNENALHRAEVDSFFRFDDDSPFRRDTTIRFEGLKWFPVNPRFRVTSALNRYEQPETVTVMGTKGEERRQLRYGYFAFKLPDEQGAVRPLRINVYKFTPSDSLRYLRYRDNLSVWFRDRTSGRDTYLVGRYVEVGNENPDPRHEYVLDFNKAYNPYCAYSAMYSCAVPRKDDSLDIALHVGEMKYHD